MDVRVVKSAEVVENINDATEGEVTEEDLVAFDITFSTEEGEVQPLVPISVTFENVEVDGDTLQVFHMDDENGEASAVTGELENTGKVEVEAEKFSIYVIVAGKKAVTLDNVSVNLYKGADAATKGAFLVKNDTVNAYFVKDTTENITFSVDKKLDKSAKATVSFGKEKEGYSADQVYYKKNSNMSYGEASYVKVTSFTVTKVPNGYNGSAYKVTAELADKTTVDVVTRRNGGYEANNLSSFYWLQTVAEREITEGPIHWTRTTESAAQVKNNPANKKLSWNWTDVSGIDHSVSDLKKVWDGNFARNYTLYINNTLKHNYATWKRYSSADNAQDIRRFYGTFTIPEGLDATDKYMLSAAGKDEYAAFNGGNIIPINDDIFIFVYKEGTTLTNDTFMNYLAFWTGTSNQDGIVKFNGVQGTKSIHLKKESDKRWDTLAHTDGWYCEATIDNIGETIYKNFPDAAAGDKFVIDVFVTDYAEGGGMDELVLTTAENHKAAVRINYYKDEVSDSNLLGSFVDKNLEPGTWCDYSGKLNDYKPSKGSYGNGEVQDGKSLSFTAEADGNTVINIVYHQNLNYTVKYLEKGTEAELAPGITQGPVAAGTVINIAEKGYNKTIANYQYCDDNPTTCTITSDNTVIKLYYEREKGALQITKAVNGDAGIPSDKEYEFVVKDSQNNQVGEIIKLKVGGSYTVSDLPTGSYAVEENTPTGLDDYTWSVAGTGAAVVSTGNTTQVTVTNTFEKKTGSLKIVKTLAKTSEQVTIPGETTFTVYNAANEKVKTFQYKEMTNGAYVLANQPVGEYYVIESGYEVADYTAAAPQGTGTANTVKIASGKTATLTVTNSYSRDMGTLTITKALGAESDENAEIPAETTFQLMQKQGDSFVSMGNDYKFTYAEMASGANGIKSKTFTLPTGSYYVTESNSEVISYTCVVTGANDVSNVTELVKNGTATIGITNTYTKIYGDDIINPVTLTVKKVDENGAVITSGSATFTLTDEKENTFSYSTDTATGTVEIPFNQAGSYTLTETVAPVGFEKSTKNWKITVTKSGTFTVKQDGNLWNKIYNWVLGSEDFDASNGVLTVENTSIKKDIAGTKTWKMPEGAERPTRITVELLKNVNGIWEVVGKQETYATKDWKYEWKDLPAYDENGKEIVYSVDEVDVPGFTKSIDGYDITNTIEQAYITVEGDKTWVDGGKNHDNSKEIELTLSRRVKGSTAEPEVVSTTPEWDGNHYAFTNLEKYKIESENAEVIEYEYYVNETNYDKTNYTSEKKDGNNFVNTIISNGDNNPNPNPNPNPGPSVTVIQDNVTPLASDVLGAQREPEAAEETVEDTTGEVLGESRNPQTGDDTHVWIWVLAAVASAGSIVAYARRKRQQETD